MTKNAKTELVKSPDSATPTPGFALMKNTAGDSVDFKQIIADNFGDMGIDEMQGYLGKYSLPLGGATSWMQEDGSVIPYIEGVILKHQNIRLYWSKGLVSGAEAGTPPDCVSADSKTGIGSPSGNCTACPYSQFGTARDGEGRGQACKLRCQIFILGKEDMLPRRISLPPMSMKKFKAYMVRLATKGKAFYSVITKIGLERVTNKDNLPVSAANFSMVTELPPNEVAFMKNLKESFNPKIDLTKEGLDE